MPAATRTSPSDLAAAQQLLGETIPVTVQLRGNTAICAEVPDSETAETTSLFFADAAPGLPATLDLEAVELHSRKPSWLHSRRMRLTRLPATLRIATGVKHADSIPLYTWTKRHPLFRARKLALLRRDGSSISMAVTATSHQADFAEAGQYVSTWKIHKLKASARDTAADQRQCQPSAR